jgi:hypothetical protein
MKSRVATKGSTRFDGDACLPALDDEPEFGVDVHAGGGGFAGSERNVPHDEVLVFHHGLGPISFTGVRGEDVFDAPDQLLGAM